MNKPLTTELTDFQNEIYNYIKEQPYCIAEDISTATGIKIISVKKALDGLSDIEKIEWDIDKSRTVSKHGHFGNDNPWGWRIT